MSGLRRRGNKFSNASKYASCEISLNSATVACVTYILKQAVKNSELGVDGRENSLSKSPRLLPPEAGPL